MPQIPDDAFTLWFNCNKDQKKDGHYWASAEIPVDELRRLFEWAKNADRVKNQKDVECVKLRANLMPRQSKAGNDYLLLAISDQKPRPSETPNTNDPF